MALAVENEAEHGEDQPYGHHPEQSLFHIITGGSLPLPTEVYSPTSLPNSPDLGWTNA